MAGREYLIRLYRRTSRSSVLVALVALCLASGGLMTLRQVSAERTTASSNGTRVPGSAVTSNTGTLASLAGRTFPMSDGVQGAVLAEYEGFFDGKTLTLQPQIVERGPAKDRRIFSRSDPNSEVPQGQFLFRVANTTPVAQSATPNTASGEVELTNNTNTTLYNTRVVFTSFKVTNANGADAGNLPGANGFAYFNDGQVAYGGKLAVSRAYGNIPAGGKVTQVWNFALGAQPPAFFFAYRVIADIGVAAESVAPAAVQVNASTGTSVTIAGQGFTGTPTVELLPASGSPIALTGVNATATSITGTVPAGTAAGIYSVRVTNPGGTPGGSGSSTLLRRLTVTGVPDAAHTLSGTIPALADAGPYLVSGSASITNNVTIPAGAVIYVANGATITVAGSGNVSANGGVPGVTANAAQIVITAQRSPGAAAPSAGAWGGIDASAAASSTLTMRNVVVEYAGIATSAAIRLTGSGRTLRFTDGIIRGGAGGALAANGAGDSVVGFARNRIENNGTSANDPAVLLSGNASLGLYDLAEAGTPVSTSVGDASFYYSSANDFTGNQVNAVQIGTDADATSNDFTKSGVLVGQGSTPIRIRGNCANPAIVGAVPPAAAAELTVGPAATIQLAADLNFQAGDYPTNRVGAIAANGYGGFYQGTQAATSNKYIEFDKVTGGANFGALFFSRLATAASILNYVRVQNGGANSACSLGAAQVIVEGINLQATNSQINNSGSGALQLVAGGTVNSKGSSFTGNANQIIETIAGGVLGDSNPGSRATVFNPVAVANDPQGRGVYFVDATNSGNLIRFLNTKRETVTIGGQKIRGAVIQTVVGGGLDIADDIPGRAADAGSVSGLAVSNDGDVVYWIDSGAPAVRAYNAGSAPKSIANKTIDPGKVTTLSSTGFGSNLNGLAVHPTSGDVYVADATAGINKVFKIAPAGGAPTDVAGNGATTKAEDVFSAGPATSAPLLQPRALTFDPQGNLYVADTGHARVIKVDAGGAASLMAQFPPKADSGAAPYTNNPFTSGLAFLGGKLYLANGNSQDIARVDTPGGSPATSTVAGTINTACDYTSSTCGDGEAATNAGFTLTGSTGQPPLAGLASDGKGLFVLDQGTLSKGRIRYVNVSAAAVEVAGVTVAAGNVNTIAGLGLASPFDGGLATSASFNTPTGVAVDANGNLWITDTLSSKLRFANTGATSVTIFAGTGAEQVVPAGGIVTVNKDVGSGATDDVPVNQAGFDTPQGIAWTPQGLFIADSKKGGATTGGSGRRTGLIRFVNITSQAVTLYGGTVAITVPPGNITTAVGGSTDPSNIGNGPAPRGAKLVGPTDVAIHPTTGDIFIADAGQRLVRKVVRATGVVSSLVLPAAGTGANTDQYNGLSFDSQGRLLVVNSGSNSLLREKTAGSGTAANGFDTLLTGTAGGLKRPRDVVEGKDGALYVMNVGDSTASGGVHKLVRVTVSGTTGTAADFAGTTEGYSGDGGAPLNAQLRLTADDFNVATVGSPVLVRAVVTITLGPSGEIIFTDSKNNAIRRIR